MFGTADHSYSSFQRMKFVKRYHDHAIALRFNFVKAKLISCTALFVCIFSYVIHRVDTFILGILSSLYVICL